MALTDTYVITRINCGMELIYMELGGTFLQPPYLAKKKKKGLFGLVCLGFGVNFGFSFNVSTSEEGI